MKKCYLFLLLFATTIHVLAQDNDPRQQAYYQIEYRWIPLMVKAYQEQEQEQTKELYPLNDLEIWNTYIQTNYPDIHEHFAWDSLQVYTMQSDSLNMIIYDFPEPFNVPLAAYGAVVIRPNAITYYTFEKSYDGYYVLGTIDAEWTHTNLGFYLSMPIDEFICIVCEKENIPVIKHYPPEY